MSTKPPSGKAPAWTPFFRRFVNERSVDMQATMELHKEVGAIWRASMWSHPDTLRSISDVTFKRLQKRVPVPDDFHEPVKEIIKAIFQEQHLLFTFPSWKEEELSLKEQVQLREYLRKQRDLVGKNEDKSADWLAFTVIDALEPIITAIPKQTRDGIPLLKVPLLEAMTRDAGKVVQEITNAFFKDEALDSTGLFADLRRQIYTNACHASGFEPFEETRKELVPAYNQDMPAEELVQRYLAHTPFQGIFDQMVPLEIARERFNEHGAIFGRSGHGKTQALRSFVASFLTEPDPPALFLIDSLGALIKGIDRLEVFTTTLRDRLVILDPSRPEHMPRLNLFSGIQSDELIFYLFKAIDQSFTQRQATMASYLMEYMRVIPSPDPMKLVEFCKSKTNPYPQYLSKLSPFARMFFETEFFAAGKGADAFIAQTKAQIAARLFTLGRLPKFNQMLSSETGLFDPLEHMQRKSVVLINTDARPVHKGGLGIEGSAILGRFILAQCLEAARTRPEYKRHLVLLIVDEAKGYMDEHSALILSDARQYGMGMLLASQQPHQFPEGVRKEINTNTSIRMMGNLEYAVASQYSKDMFCEPEFILGMKKYDRRYAEWALFVSGMDHAVKVEVPYGAIERMPRRSSRLVLKPRQGNVTTATHKPAEAYVFTEQDIQEDFDACYEQAMPEEQSTGDDHIRPVRE